MSQVSEICLTPQSFVKISMCSYERAGWLGCQDLGFSNRDPGKRAGNFALHRLQPGYLEENNTMHFRDRADITGAPNENIVLNHLNTALLNVF